MKKIKANAGITGIDIAISLGMIAITLAILSALYLNIYVVNTEIERRTQAMNYATQILEKVSEYYYADVTTENFSVTETASGKNQVAGIEIPKAYNVEIDIQNYKTEEASDVVKNVEITIIYKVGNKDNTVTLSKLKTKEVLIVPNKPELEDDMVAIKKQSNSLIYKETSALDSRMV